MSIDVETPREVPIEKLADTASGVHELFRIRWSPRSFSAREISDSDLLAVLDAARWAASSYNEQPWRFLVARKSDREGFNRILSVLVPVNQMWAKSASVLIIMAAKKVFTHNGTENYYALHDCGAACAHILLESAALGFHGHGMAGFDREKARQELGIPNDYMLGAAIALGYAGSPDDLQMEERFRKAERAKRERRPLKEIAFGPGWEHPLALES